MQHLTSHRNTNEEISLSREYSLQENEVQTHSISRNVGVEHLMFGSCSPTEETKTRTVVGAKPQVMRQDRKLVWVEVARACAEHPIRYNNMTNVISFVLFLQTWGKTVLFATMNFRRMSLNS